MSKYQIVIEEKDKYLWSAGVNDASQDDPKQHVAQTINDKSLGGLLAKILTAVMLRDLDLKQPQAKPPELKRIIVPPTSLAN